MNRTGARSSSSSRACPRGSRSRWSRCSRSWRGGGSGYGRGPRMRFEQDEVTIIGGVRHGRTLGSPVAIEIGNTEWDRDPDKWQKEMSVRGGGRADPGAAHPGAAGPRRPGRHAEVRLHRRPRRAGAGVGPRDRGPRRRRLRGQGAARRARRRHREPRRSRWAPRARRRPPGPARPTWPRSTSRRCGASTPPPRRRWSPRSRRRPRTATASAASWRCSPTACPSGSAATCTGTASSTRCWPGRSCRSRR